MLRAEWIKLGEAYLPKVSLAVLEDMQDPEKPDKSRDKIQGSCSL